MRRLHALHDYREAKGLMNDLDDIEEIKPCDLPYSLDEKIFYYTGLEDENSLSEPFSYNDWIKNLENIAGISSYLMGQND